MFMNCLNTSMTYIRSNSILANGCNDRREKVERLVALLDICRSTMISNGLEHTTTTTKPTSICIYTFWNHYWNYTIFVYVKDGKIDYKSNSPIVIDGSFHHQFRRFTGLKKIELNKLSRHNRKGITNRLNFLNTSAFTSNGRVWRKHARIYFSN